MNEQEFEELKNDIKAYRDAKNEVLKKIEIIRQDVREGKRYLWVIDIVTDELYKELFQSDTRQKFIEQAKKAGEDSDFEKYFRSAHLEIFIGININPNAL